MTPPAIGPRTDMAADMALPVAEFYEKYRWFRASVARAYRYRAPARWLDAIFRRLENAAVGDRTRQPVDRPIFITGAFRSGTTMLERVVAEHPSVAAFDHLAFQFPTAPYLARAVQALAGRRSSAQPHQPNMAMTSDWPAEAEQLWRYCRRNPWADGPSDVLAAGDRDAAFERILLQSIHKLLRQRRASRFVNKNPLNTLRVGYLGRLFPSARFVHLVRHPLRVLQSQIDLEKMWARILEPARGRDYSRAFCDTFMPPGRRLPRTRRAAEIAATQPRNPTLAVAMSLCDMQREYDDAVNESRLAPRVLRLRYEDLLAEFAAEMTKVFAHIDLQDAAASEIVATADTGLVDRGLVSSAAPLPRFDTEVEAELEPLLRAYHAD